MSNSPENPQRRRALFTLIATAAALPFVGAVTARRAVAGDMPHLAEDDPTAKALKYHHDATEAPRTDKAGTPAGEQVCSNCQFIKSDSGQWRPCQIFPGKLVNADGWCTSWMAQS